MKKLETIPTKGCWIMIRTLIPVEIPIDPLSVFYATPIKKKVQKEWSEIENEDYFGYKTPAQIEARLYKEEVYARINTEFGSVQIKPHEYSIVNDQNLEEYFESIKDEHAFIHFFSKNKMQSNKLEEAVFYIRQRGISYTTAMQMCLGLITSPNVFYITMHEEYQRMFIRNYDSYKEKKINFLNKRKQILEENEPAN